MRRRRRARRRPARLAADRKKKVVVALDEFQAVAGFNGGSVEHALRAAVQHQRRILPCDARIAREAHELAIERLCCIGEELCIDGDCKACAFGFDHRFHLAFGRRTRGEHGQVGEQSLFDVKTEQRIEARRQPPANVCDIAFQQIRAWVGRRR